MPAVCGICKSWEINKPIYEPNSCKLITIYSKQQKVPEQFCDKCRFETLMIILILCHERLAKLLEFARKVLNLGVDKLIPLHA